MGKKSLPYAVELDGSLTHHQNGRLSQLTSLKNLKGDCRVVTDFQNAISRTMTIEADSRFVELMISRKLQESGEFDEPVTVISHWKKKRGKNTSDIFFTALPAKRYFQYLELVGEHADHLVLLPLQSVLLSVLKIYGKDKPVAVVFQHGRFADMLVGTRRKVWYANRVVAFDESQEQISALWETVRTDIETVADDHYQPVGEVYGVTWTDTGPLPEWSADGCPEFIPLREETLDMAGQEVRASLPCIIGKTAAGHAVASFKDRLFYGARRMMPALNMVLLLGALVAGTVGIWYHVLSAGLQEKIEAKLVQVQTINTRLPKRMQPVNYERTLDFVDQLWTCHNLPTYQQILSDVGKGIDGTLRVENIKADYSDDRVEIKAFGTAEAPFETSYKAYQKLRKRLLQRGYQMTDERFDTRINASQFVLHFAKEVR
jgi:hypothetical protein